MKFDRMQISFVNVFLSDRTSKVKGTAKIKKIAVPEKETFKYIFENAKKGNEMAAVLIDDWQRNCEPKNDNEKKIINMINTAANRIFR